MTAGRLFDTTTQVSPEDAVKRKGRARAPKAAEQEEPQNLSTPIVRRLGPPIGRLDEGVECCDETCRSGCHDISDIDGGMWLVHCFACGTGQWIRAIKGVLDKPDADDAPAFRLRGGRFDGLTFDEVSCKQHGAEYIGWAAKEHPRQIVRDAAKKWLAAREAVC